MSATDLKRELDSAEQHLRRCRKQHQDAHGALQVLEAEKQVSACAEHYRAALLAESKGEKIVSLETFRD